MIDATTHDPVEHPAHYTAHPSGIECIQVTERIGFNLGNAVKYVWRADLKTGTPEGALEDLRKAAWYVDREIGKRTAKAQDVLSEHCCAVNPDQSEGGVCTLPFRHDGGFHAAQIAPDALPFAVWL